MNLTAKQCTPCRGGVPPLSRAEAERLLRETPGWTLDADATRIERTFKTADFASALALVEKIAVIAEAESHHRHQLRLGLLPCRLLHAQDQGAARERLHHGRQGERAGRALCPRLRLSAHGSGEDEAV